MWRHFDPLKSESFCLIVFDRMVYPKVFGEKSRGEGSLIVQDTIENVSESKFFFFDFLGKKEYIF